MSEPLALGIDIGTTAVKAGVFDRSGTMLGLARTAYVTRRRADLVEQDPDDWWRAMATAIGRLAESVDLTEVGSIGVVGQVNTHLCVDRELRPLGPAIVWQDQRCAAIAGRLSAHGATISSSHVAARAAWWAEHRPDQWARTRWVLSPKDYINARLTGIAATDRRTAREVVGGDGYLPEIGELVDGLRERLPPLCSPTEELDPILENDLGLPADALVVVGTMDAWGDIYGSGAIKPGDAFLIGGTSEIIGCVSDRHVPTAGVVTFPKTAEGFFVHAGPTQAGGDAARWWADVRGSTIDELISDAAKAPAGSGNVVFLPHLLGERAPLWDPEARGVFLGLSTATSGAELARAVLEGVAFSIRELFEAAEHACGRPAERITISGGTTRSDLWCQIKADVLGRQLQRLAVPDTAVLGAALLGGVGTGLYPNMAAAIEQAVRVEHVFHPGHRSHRRYTTLFEVYREGYQALRPVHARLAAIRAEAAAE